MAMKLCRCGRAMRGQGATPMETCLRDIDQTDRYVCDERTQARAMGFREGVAMAKENAKPKLCERHAGPPVFGGPIEWDRASCSECGSEVDFGDVDAELVRWTER